MSLSDLWKDFQTWIDRRCGTDPNEDLRRAIGCRFLVIISWQLTAVIAARLIHVWILLPEVTTAKLVTLAGGFIFFALPWLLFRTRSMVLAGGLLVGITFCIVAQSIVTTGGIASSNIPFLAIYPLMAGFLIGSGAALVALGVTCAFILALIGLDGTPYIGVPAFMPEQVKQSLATASMLSAGMSCLIVVNFAVIARSAYQRLHEALDMANAANQAKSDFLATMSHELRTPLNGVMGMLGLLIDSPVSKEQRFFAVTARESANSLLALLNDILDFSRLEAGHITKEVADFNLSQTINQICSLVGPKAEAKSLALESEIDPNLPQWLRGDATRLRQILFNFLDNAIKFTDEGRVTLKVLKVKDNDETIEIAFRVEDTGVGIDTLDIPRLFERFEQADMSMRRRHGGAGLGLAITRKLVDLLNGRIDVESTAGQGSAFTARLTFAEGARTIPVLNSRQEDRPHLPLVLRVLLVEDHHINQMLTHTMLTKLGHLVDIAGNGQEALEMLDAARYDVVLMDIQMPVMDGVQATKAIRSLDAPRCDIPIIAVTANVLHEQRTAYLAAGMDDFVAKPIDPRLLLDTIDSVLRSRAGIAATPPAHKARTD